MNGKIKLSGILFNSDDMAKIGETEFEYPCGIEVFSRLQEKFAKMKNEPSFDTMAEYALAGVDAQKYIEADNELSPKTTFKIKRWRME